MRNTQARFLHLKIEVQATQPYLPFFTSVLYIEGQEVTWLVTCLEEGEMAKYAPKWINSSCCYALIVDGPAVVATEAGGNADEDNEEVTQPNVDEANANEGNGGEASSKP